MPKSFMQFLDQKSATGGSAKDILQNLLALLHSTYWNYYTTHWQVKGESYYETHLLFQRLYESLPAEIDSLGEKLVAYFKSEAVDQKEIVAKTKVWTDKMAKNTDPISRAMDYEVELQRAIKSAYETLKEANEMSLGLDDFLMGLANDHETHVYLLGQIKR